MNLGIHVGSTIGNYPNIAIALQKRTKQFNLSIAQIFVATRFGKDIVSLYADTITSWAKDNNIQLIVHSTYTTSSMWNIDPIKQASGLKRLHTQLDLAKTVNATGVIVHLPKKHYKHVASVVNNIDTDITILLEHPTYKSDINCSYEMPYQLNRLAATINSDRNWGYVIDTAHIWSSITLENRTKGYTIETYEGMDKWLSELDELTVNKIKVIHLNGSHNEHSSNKDKHAIPIYGINESQPDKIWTNNDKNIKIGLHRIIEFAHHNHIPLIIERTSGSDVQLKKSLDFISSYNS